MMATEDDGGPACECEASTWPAEDFKTSSIYIQGKYSLNLQSEVLSSKKRSRHRRCPPITPLVGWLVG
jgi:hypothetical protein